MIDMLSCGNNKWTGETQPWLAGCAGVNEKYIKQLKGHRRRQLAQLGSATGVYKTLVKYLVGVPQVWLL